MKTYQMKLTSGPFKKIASSQKTIESRLNDEKRQIINTGDIIEFLCIDDPRKKISTKIKCLYKHNSFKDYNLPYLNLLKAR